VSSANSFSTENISGYLTSFDLQGKTILTVGSSGDHFINSYFYGAGDVVCFDVNIFEKYFSELKLAALRNLDFEQFKSFLFRSKENSRVLAFDTYKKMKQELSLPAQRFFDGNYKAFKTGAAIRESEIFNNLFDEPQKKISNNPYLSDIVNFEKAKRAIVDKELRWIVSDVQELASKISEKFDLIFLSNISDYSHLMFKGHDYLFKYREFVVSPLLEKLSSDGTIVFAYIYDAENVFGSDKRNDINNSSLRRKIFSDISGTEYGEIIFKSAIEDITKDVVAYIKKYE
jgi:hypothetical protein